jgi:hypothetical protein
VIDSRKRREGLGQSSSSGVTEDSGITYRKD